MAWQNEAAYTYDETNRMVSGKNEQGEYSLYTYNGLGLRVGRELIMKDNTHGYTDFHDLTPSVDAGIDKPEVVKESYVIDYTSATFNPLTMDEEGGFSYRYVYGLNTLSVKITSEGTNWWGQHVTTDILKDYYHQDRLGSTTNLTDKFGRVVGRADYNEWGEITYREALSITSSYRRIWPQSSYTGHDWDDVLGMYYAKARFYSAEDKRFVAMDPVKGQIIEPLSLVPYVYCVDNPLRWVDSLGMSWMPLVLLDGIIAHIAIEAYIILNFEGVKAEVYIKETTHNKSKFGFADIMIKNGRGYDIYEIKPTSYYEDFALGTLAFNQINSYKDAINKHNTIEPNKNYVPAYIGKAILNDINDQYIKIPGDEGRVIHIITHPDTKPGMIYYEYIDCDKVPQHATVLSPNYSEETKKRIARYREAAEAQPNVYNREVIYADTINDEDYFDYAFAIGALTIQTTEVYYGIQFTKLQSIYYDWETLWRVDGLRLFDQPIKTEKLTPAEIYLIFEGNFLYRRGWYNSISDAVINWLFSSNVPVLPGGVPGFVGAPI